MSALGECYAIVSRDYMRGIIISLLFSFIIVLYANYTKDETLLSWLTLYGLFLPILVTTALFVNFQFARGCPIETTFPEEPELRILAGLAIGSLILFPSTLVAFFVVTVAPAKFTLAEGVESVLIAVMLQWAIVHWENGVVYFVPDALANLSGQPAARPIFVVLIGSLMGVLHQWAYGNVILTLASCVFFIVTGLMYHGYIPFAPAREPEGYVLAHFVWNCTIVANLTSTMPGLLAVFGLIAFLFITRRIGI